MEEGVRGRGRGRAQHRVVLAEKPRMERWARWQIWTGTATGGGGSVLSQKLSDAYCVLADEQRRRLAYDLFGSTGDIF